MTEMEEIQHKQNMKAVQKNISAMQKVEDQQMPMHGNMVHPEPYQDPNMGYNPIQPR